MGNNGPTPFHMDDHLYKYIPPHIGTSLLQTQEENESQYTPCQVECTKVAHSFLYRMGTPSIKDLKATICAGIIKDCPVTVSDVDITETLYGPNIGTLKGKTTRSKPVACIPNFMEIPRKSIRISFCVLMLCMSVD